MRTNRFWILFVVVAIATSFPVSDVWGQVIREKFSYGDKPAAGSVNVKVLAIGMNSRKSINLRNRQGIIDLNEFENEEVQLILQFHALKLGLKTDDLKTEKYQRHKTNFYLEVPYRSDFMPKSFDGLKLINSREIQISQGANISRRESTNIVYGVSDGNHQGEVTTSFRIVRVSNDKKWSAGMNFSFPYRIIARKPTEEIDPFIAEAKALFQEILTSSDPEKKLLEGRKYLGLYKSIDASQTAQIEQLVADLENTIGDGDEEEEVWKNLKIGVEAGNNSVVLTEANYYLKEYPQGRFIAEVYYHAIDHPEK